MKMSFVPGSAALGLGLTLLLSGCETTSTNINNTALRQLRIQDKAAVYAQLTPELQTKVTKGVIEVGYTSDMVYLALGAPSKKKEKTATEGTVELWSYNTYYPTVTATQLSLNNPGARFQPFTNSVSMPDLHAAGAGAAGAAPSLFSTTGGPTPSLGLADLPLETVYVTLYNNKVIKISLEST